jgi:hypothetical protein
MDQLMLEIKIHIASKAWAAWAKLALADPVFCKWAADNVAVFMRTFATNVYTTAIVYKLESQHELSSWFDYPSVIQYIPERGSMWSVWGNMMRYGDYPAVIRYDSGCREWVNKPDGDGFSNQPLLCRDEVSPASIEDDMLKYSDSAEGEPRIYSNDALEYPNGNIIMSNGNRIISGARLDNMFLCL